MPIPKRSQKRRTSPPEFILNLNLLGCISHSNKVQVINHLFYEFRVPAIQNWYTPEFFSTYFLALVPLIPNKQSKIIYLLRKLRYFNFNETLSEYQFLWWKFWNWFFDLTHNRIFRLFLNNLIELFVKFVDYTVKIV
jgi:hypothetical protein